MSAAEPRDLAGEELSVGLVAEFEREIRAEDVLAFAELSGDANPLHVDADYAQGTNYGRPIVHGAFQVSLASALAGMHLPGKRVVLGALRSRFAAPLYHPCRVRVRGEIVSWVPGAGSGILRVRIEDLATSAVTAEIHLSFSLHEARASAPTSLSDTDVETSATGRELVVVTGARGAVGRRLCERLAAQFDVLELSRHAEPAASASVCACDLESDDWESALSQTLGARSAYAVVHAAWPGAPRGGLLELELDAIGRQLDFGGLVTIRLARWLSQHAAASGRLVLLGSTAGTLNPELGLSGYSLGKATLEHTLRLLAPELARRAVTVNAILPSYMPLGMNQAKTERATLLEAARVPLGRLCSPDDICGAVEYLLSPAAAFVTGQLLPLTGGKL